MLTFVCWRWRPQPGYRSTFAPETVTALRDMIARHYARPHRFLCITDDQASIDRGIETMPLWSDHAAVPNPNGPHNPSCYRRLKVFAPGAREIFGEQLVSIDLDTVIVDDITPLVDRADPFVAYWIEYAKVFSGSLILMNTGYLDEMFQTFAADPEGFPVRIQSKGVASDQAMLNWFIRLRQPPMGRWTERDGIVLYFGKGYERFEHLGVGPTRATLPAGARMVAFGSADLDVLNHPTLPFIQEHYR